MLNLHSKLQIDRLYVYIVYIYINIYTYIAYYFAIFNPSIMYMYMLFL